MATEQIRPETTGRRWAGYALLVWIVASALFFYVRFSFAFFHANQDAIRSALGH